MSSDCKASCARMAPIWGRNAAGLKARRPGRPRRSGLVPGSVSPYAASAVSCAARQTDGAFAFLTFGFFAALTITLRMLIYSFKWWCVIANVCFGPEAPIPDLRKLSCAHDVALLVRCTELNSPRCGQGQVLNAFVKKRGKVGFARPPSFGGRILRTADSLEHALELGLRTGTVGQERTFVHAAQFANTLSSATSPAGYSPGHEPPFADGAQLAR